MRIRTRLAIAAATIVAAAVPAVAQAAPDTVVDFNDLPDNTAPANHYMNSAGVQFGIPADFGLPAFGSNNNCKSEPSSTTAGINGASMTIGCYTGGEFSLASYQAAINFMTERRGVSFNLRAPKGVTGPVTITLIRDNGTAIESRVVNLPAGQVVPISFTHATPDIDVVTLTAPGDGYNHPDVLQLDDLRAPQDDVPPPPKFAVGVTETSIDVPEQGTTQTKLSIRRINGSTGPITLSVAGLPGGIAATKIDPNPASGTNPPMLSVTAGGPASGSRQLTITASGTASAGTNVSQPVVENANIVPALIMPDQLAERSTGGVAGCPTTYTQYIRVHGSFSGPVTMTTSTDSGPATITGTPVTEIANGEGSLGFPLTVNQPRGQDGDSYVHLTFSSPGVTTQTTTLRVNSTGDYVPHLNRALSFGSSVGFTDQWLPETTPGPRDQRGSDQIQVQGTFPTGCNYAFKDDLGQPLKIVKMEQGFRGGDPSTGADRVILQLPNSDKARSTSITETEGLTGPSSKITLRTFRNSWGFNGVNSGEGAGTTDFSWSDFLRTFGSDDGDDCVPILGCVRDPGALIAWHFISKKLEGQNGICFGWATMALRFERGIERPSDYQPGARYPYDISHPEQEGSAIKQQLVRWQAAQQDQGWRHYTDALKDNVPSITQFHDQLKAALQRDDAVTLGFRSGDEGHAVDAYDMRELGGGSFEILTYNPNFPYTSGEQSSTMTRDTAVQASKIIVAPHGENFAGGGIWIAYAPSSTTPWVGDMSNIEVYDHLPPSNADLPDNPEHWLAEASNWLSSAGTDPTNVSQIAVDGKDALKADGTPRAGSGLGDEITPSGSSDDISYVLNRGHRYDLTLTGQGAGKYSEAVMGGGDIAAVTTTRGAGEADHVTIVPGKAQIGLAGGGAVAPATIDVADHPGHGVSRAVEATLSTGSGRSDTVAIAGGDVSLRHGGGPTTVAMTISTAGNGAPGSIVTAPMRVGAGQQLVVHPAWSGLAAGATYTLRDGRGRVLRRGRVALRASTKVRFASRLSAKLRGRRVVVRGSIAKPGSAPLLIVTAQAVQGGRVVATASVDRRGAKAVRRGRFSVPVTLRRLPAGATVRVSATLIDEGAGLATARAAGTAGR